MDKQAKAKFDAMVEDLATDLKPLVDNIESSLATTRNHYGRYMQALVTLAKGDKATAAVIYSALLKAGANPQGLGDAYKAAFGH